MNIKRMRFDASSFFYYKMIRNKIEQWKLNVDSWVYSEIINYTQP
jgi:hypothetical protein